MPNVDDVKDVKWLIWSNEHNKWWKPNSFGYSETREEAGRYTYSQARRILDQANIDPDHPQETMVPE